MAFQHFKSSQCYENTLLIQFTLNCSQALTSTPPPIPISTLQNPFFPIKSSFFSHKRQKLISLVLSPTGWQLYYIAAPATHQCRGYETARCTHKVRTHQCPGYDETGRYGHRVRMRCSRNAVLMSDQKRGLRETHYLLRNDTAPTWSQPTFFLFFNLIQFLFFFWLVKIPTKIKTIAS
jgi:hypothetical protein